MERRTAVHDEMLEIKPNHFQIMGETIEGRFENFESSISTSLPGSRRSKTILNC